uniref:Uncharacterized protein n=1 Tax=Micrurus lemniscatus lemniscatus TaxID=129467 RepID=A0A2D4ITW2_MICLE
MRFYSNKNSSEDKGRANFAPWLGFCSCLLILQKRPLRENDLKQISSSSSGSLSPNAAVQNLKHEWKIVASEKTSSKPKFVAGFTLDYLIHVKCRTSGRNQTTAHVHNIDIFSLNDL